MSFWQNWHNPRTGLINFTATDGPRYTGSYAPAATHLPGRFKVISWNIKFALHIETALQELQHVPALTGADILLLQEMDNDGTAQLARELGHNYIYYPASIHNRTGRPFGNAILSRWPILDSHKILLPHASPYNRQRRIAAGAVVALGSRRVAAYSVHTETPALPPGRRTEQFAHLSEQASLAMAATDGVIVGGDFNTFTGRSVRTLQQMMGAVGLSAVVPGRSTTLATPLARFHLDHLFTSGLTPHHTGIWPHTAASDHYPLWATLQMTR